MSGCTEVVLPITSFKCSVCHSAKVDLTHFATTNCGLAVHPDYVAAVLAEQQDNFPDGKVRVSAASSCPRSAAIMRDEPVTVDPLAFNAMLTGTGWHTLMAAHATDPALCEIEVSGIIDGISMCGHIDRLLRHESGLVIADWKHANDFSRKYLKDVAKPEHIVQTSLYAELYAQQHGERPTRGVNWYHFTSSPPFAPMWYDLWPVAKCLDHKPYECEFTVRQILHQAADFAVGKVKWTDLPLVGASFQFSGKSACDYCAAFDACQTQATGAPF
jgi:PD-(D/E)XK nuclease superfamily